MAPLLLLPAVASLLLVLCLPLAPPAAAEADPTPTPWPLQFHAKLIMDYRGNLSLTDLWYDWPGGRNLHVIRYQLAADEPYYDNEWNNGTSFFYTPARRTCRSVAVGVGILRPDWLLPGAVYLGRRDAGGFDCHVWTKADFITYYEDVDTKRPVKWVFYTGRTSYVMSFEVGAVLEDAAWQAPEYCFTEDGEMAETRAKIPEGHGMAWHHDEDSMLRPQLGDGCAVRRKDHLQINIIIRWSFELTWRSRRCNSVIVRVLMHHIVLLWMCRDNVDSVSADEMTKKWKPELGSIVALIYV